MQEEISRVKRDKDQASTNYSRMSRFYDLVAGNCEKKYRIEGLRQLGVTPGEQALEIGFGTGQAIVSMAQSVGGSGKVYGIDISEGMLNVASRRVSKAKVSQRVVLKRDDAADLPFKEDFFDAIFVCFTLELFDTPEIPIVLRECMKVLKENGRICVVSLAKKEKSSPMAVLYMIARRIFPGYLDCRPIFVREAVEDAGFRTIECTEMSMWGLPVDIVLTQKVPDTA
jgi:demethylmenaquinone methyltransferase/2-methoxy-6-polyprenyl-1,4-benzoquinol methylase